MPENLRNSMKMHFVYTMDQVLQLALERLARIPTEGDTFELGPWKVEIGDMDGKRIDKLLFMPIADAQAAE